MTLAELVEAMRKISIADIREATDETHALFETVTNGLVSCINMEQSWRHPPSKSMNWPDIPASVPTPPSTSNRG